MTAIAIQGLTKRLGQFQLDIPEFTLEEGCVAGFVGRNGAGKTTTMKLMMHMIFPDNGKIELLGLDVAKDGCNIREQLGYVGETMGFLDQAPLHALKKMVQPFYKQWDEAYYQQLLERFHLSEKMTYKKLSKGQQKQFALVLALSHHPRLLLLDEPTANLDPVMRNEMLDIILEQMEREEVTVFYSTHITSDLEKAADYVVFLNKGRILLQQDKDSLEQNHCLVKGKKDVLLQSTGSELLDITWGPLGFRALSKDPAASKRTFGKDAIYEHASIEDIFIAYEEEWEKEELQ